MSTHSVYLVSGLEDRNNGDPLNGIIIDVVVSHGLLTVLEVLWRPLKIFLRILNEARRVSIRQTNGIAPSLSASFFRPFGLAHVSRPRVCQSRGCHHK
jgi:hypothetical protein